MFKRIQAITSLLFLSQTLFATPMDDISLGRISLPVKTDDIGVISITSAALSKQKLETYPLNVVQKDLKLDIKPIKPAPNVFLYSRSRFRQEMQRYQVAATTKPLQINSPEQLTKIWLIHNTSQDNHILHKKLETTQFVTKPITMFDRFRAMIDKGFLAQPSRENISTEVGLIKDTTGKRYTLAFDDHDLVYFDIENILAPRSFRAQVDMVPSKKSPIFSKQGRVELSRSVKNVILSNTSNHAGIQEANHISLAEGHIILDIKEPGSNQSLNREYLNKTINAIKSRNSAQSSENLLRTEWKPRKRITPWR